jgi:hypothetical protein
LPQGERAQWGAWPTRLASLRDRLTKDAAVPVSHSGTIAVVSQPGGAPGALPGRQQPGPAALGEPAPQPGNGSSSPPATRMTARGAVVVMFLLFLMGTLAAGWLHLELLAGLSFVTGCALAAYYSRRDALLTAVVTPPLVFMVALVIAELLTSHADTVRHSLTSAAEGIILTLAGVAPWLFIGVVIGLIIALMRGLPQSVRDLGSELRGDLGLRGTSANREPSGQRDPRGASGGRS